MLARRDPFRTPAFTYIGARVRHLRTVSYLMTALGLVLIVAALAADRSAAVLLSGLLLVVAGMVKIVMVAIWHSVAGMGVPATDEDR